MTTTAGRNCKINKRRQHSRGFTLTEMLVVVAIIAVLIAIAVPIYASTLSKFKVATDAANNRTLKAMIMASYMIDYSVAGLPSLPTSKPASPNVALSEDGQSAVQITADGKYVMSKQDKDMPIAAYVYTSDSELKVEYYVTAEPKEKG